MIRHSLTCVFAAAVALGLAAAPALAQNGAPVPKDGIASLGDLDAGAQDWHTIAPHAAGAAPPAGSPSDVAQVAPVRHRRPAPPTALPQKDALLTIEPPLPQPPANAGPSRPLWFMPAAK